MCRTRVVVPLPLQGRSPRGASPTASTIGAAQAMTLWAAVVQERQLGREDPDVHRTGNGSHHCAHPSTALAPLRACLEPGCSQLVERGRCRVHRQAFDASHHRPRESQRWYRSKAWKARTKRFLGANPACACGCGRLAETVDHIIPYGTEGAPGFWDESNWQGLTFACHSRKTREDVASRVF